jgi:hypothetical protein
MPDSPALTDRQQRLIRRNDFWIAHFGHVLFAILSWLRSGQWPDLTWRDALGWWDIVVPRPAWVGLSRIVDWVMSLPFALAPFLIASLILWVLLHGENDPELKDARQIVAQSKIKPAF